MNDKQKEIEIRLLDLSFRIKIMEQFFNLVKNIFLYLFVNSKTILAIFAFMFLVFYINYSSVNVVKQINEHTIKASKANWKGLKSVIEKAKENK